MNTTKRDIDNETSEYRSEITFGNTFTNIIIYYFYSSKRMKIICMT